MILHIIRRRYKKHCGRFVKDTPAGGYGTYSSPDPKLAGAAYLQGRSSRSLPPQTSLSLLESSARLSCLRRRHFLQIVLPKASVSKEAARQHSVQPKRSSSLWLRKCGPEITSLLCPTADSI